MNKRTLFIFFSVFLFSLQSFGTVNSIPFGMLFSQLVNVSLLAILVYFSQKKRVVSFFQIRRENFLENVRESKELKEQVQSRLGEVTQKLNEISETFDKRIEEAAENAEKSYRDQLSQARTQALYLQKTVEKNFEFESQKQLENLRKETFFKSIQMAEREIKENLFEEKQKVWNNYFISGREV